METRDVTGADIHRTQQLREETRRQKEFKLKIKQKNIFTSSKENLIFRSTVLLLLSDDSE